MLSTDRDMKITEAKMNYKGKYYILLPVAAVDRIVGR